jgi:hypothetical protein
MKKIYARRLLLFCTLALSFLYGRSQIIVFVQEPPALVGNYDFTWADPGSGWGTPDLNDPANAVVDTLAFVDDGTVGDSLGCDPLVNGAAIAGKIAVVYRGTCEFGAKAFNAQEVGAVACIIINNIPGAPVGMGAGAQGVNDTIPVVMISADAGALLKSEIEAGHVIAYIGSIAGNYPNNLSIYKADVLVAAQTALPKQVASDASEFSVSPGAWVHNYGTNDQTGVTLNADVSVVGGSSVYNQTSSGVDIFALDSAFITLPDFSQPSYDGRYRLSYTVASGVTDDFPNDDTFETDFLIDSIFSYGSLDPAIDLPAPADFYQPSGLAGTFESCVAFMDPNGSRLGVTGMYVAVSASAADSVTGNLAEIYAYQWNDVFTDLNDPNATVADISEIGHGEYTYLDNSLEGDRIFIPFADAFALEDDMRYLFCLTTSAITLFHGFDNHLDYNHTMDLVAQPTTVIDDAGTWYLEGFGRDIPSAIGVRMIDADDVGVAENALDPSEIMVYPNPSVDLVQIPLNGVTGDAQLDIMDLDGKVVATQRVAMGNDHTLVADVTSVANGTYMFKLTLDGGSTTSFRVVVSK